MKRLYLDIESCGLYGMPVTIQYAWDDGPVQVHDVWYEPAGKTLDLIDSFLPHCVVGFNLIFDWFMVCKVYTTFLLVERDAVPIDHIDRLGVLEKEARDGPCVKPASAVDLMLEARRGPLSMVMERDDVRVRKVPAAAADAIARELNDRCNLDPLLFARKKVKSKAWVVEDALDELKDPIPGLKNVVLRFRPGGGLKHLATHLFGANTVAFDDVGLPKHMRPKELGYAPYALAVGDPGMWNGSWPDLVKYHAMHWRDDAAARGYAAADIDLTRKLDDHFGHPEPGHYDSLLAVQCAAARWKGFEVDVPALKLVRQEFQSQLVAPLAPGAVKDWINEVLPPIEQAIAWLSGTNKAALKKLARDWKDVNPEAARRAEEVLKARKAKKKIELMDKLITAGRFHVSTKVIGTLTGRMGGADKLNATGIDSSKQVRSCFPLAFADECLWGGDMTSYEVAIFHAATKDPGLKKQLMTCDVCDDQMDVTGGKFVCRGCGGHKPKSFHGLFGASIWPDFGYRGVMATQSKPGDKYKPSKIAGLATIYGAQPAKLAGVLGVPTEQAVEGLGRFWREHPIAYRHRMEGVDRFTAIRNHEYKPMSPWVESLFGYKRYYTVENTVLKDLWDLLNDLPEAVKRLPGKVTRSAKGEQTVLGACVSALLAAAFSIQNAAQRQAGNHEIQASGAQGLKLCQVNANALQPVGVHPWVTRSFQVHDELMTANRDAATGRRVKEIVDATVEEFRKTVPLCVIDFIPLKVWADKS